MKSLVLYHGARAWEGPPEIRPSRAQRVAHGPGIYLTTSVETARKYAKGGGYVMRFELDPELGWVEDTAIDADAMIAFVRSVPRLKSRAEIIADIRRNAERRQRREVDATVLINLLVNYNAVRGGIGPLVADFLVKHGGDALLEQHARGGEEDWVVLLNPRRILSYERVKAEVQDAPRVERRARGRR